MTTQTLNISFCLCCCGNGQTIVRKCSILSVHGKAPEKASAFLSFKRTVLSLLSTGDLTDEPHVVISSESLKRYPDRYGAIFHMLPSCYKKPYYSQVNRMQCRGQGM